MDPSSEPLQLSQWHFHLLATLSFRLSFRLFFKFLNCGCLSMYALTLIHSVVCLFSLVSESGVTKFIIRISSSYLTEFETTSFRGCFPRSCFLATFCLIAASIALQRCIYHSFANSDLPQPCALSLLSSSESQSRSAAFCYWYLKSSKPFFAIQSILCNFVSMRLAAMLCMYNCYPAFPRLTVHRCTPNHWGSWLKGQSWRIDLQSRNILGHPIRVPSGQLSGSFIYCHTIAVTNDFWCPIHFIVCDEALSSSLLLSF